MLWTLSSANLAYFRQTVGDVIENQCNGVINCCFESQIAQFSGEKSQHCP
jgi:hypothetical protein